jgi:hypothetical protein
MWRLQPKPGKGGVGVTKPMIILSGSTVTASGIDVEDQRSAKCKVPRSTTERIGRCQNISESSGAYMPSHAATRLTAWHGSRAGTLFSFVIIPVRPVRILPLRVGGHSRASWV